MTPEVEGADSERPARLEAVVHGHVQGVGFRHFVKVNARGLGLTGRVRNAPDGTVRVVAEGPRRDAEALAERLGEGPPASRVHRVEVRWSEAGGTFERFRVDLGIG